MSDLKRCRICQQDKDLTEFSKNSNSKDGLHTWCKPCKRAKERKPSDAVKQQRIEYKREWRKRNPEKQKAEYRKTYIRQKEGLVKKWCYEDISKRREVGRRCYHNTKSKPENVDYRRQISCIKKRRLRSSMPPWLTITQKNEIKSIYQKCREITKATGIPHHVDHIEPIKGEFSCGLHVPWNLRIMEATENIVKSNNLKIE